MINWKEYKLGEFAEVIGGGTPSTKNEAYFGGNIPWITPKDLTNYEKKFIKNGDRNITKEGLSNSSAKLIPKNSILLTSRAPIGYLAISENEVTTNQGFKSIVVNPDIADFNFVYYLIKANIERIKGYGTGTTFAEVSATVVKNLKFKLPDLPTQTAIAEILSSLDDKIELNNKINQELENLAQTLFKHWFIDFEFPNENGEPYKSSGGEMVESELGEIPKGWVLVRLGDKYLVSDFVANGSFASLKENVSILDSPSFAIFLRNTDSKSNFTNQLRYVDEKTYKFLSKSKIIGNEICISNVADVGTVFRPPVYLKKPLTLGNNLVFFRSDYPNYFYLYFKYFQGQDQIQSITSGSAQLKFNKTDFRNLNLLDIPKTLLSTFNDRINDLWELQSNLLSENIELTNLRDTLLPKLITGELQLNELD